MRHVLKNTLLTTAALAAMVMIAVELWFPVLKIRGNSMEPTLNSGEIVFSSKASNLQAGDVAVFQQEGIIRIQRIIATPGQWVDMNAAGEVFVNGQELSGDIGVIAMDEANMKFPFLVPEGQYFMLEDSIDYRYPLTGCIPEDQILGEVIFRIWPLDAIVRIH